MFSDPRGVSLSVRFLLLSMILLLGNLTLSFFAYREIHNRSLEKEVSEIVSLSSKYRTLWGPIGAAMVVGISPSVVLYLFLSKNFQKNIQAGALKG